MISTGDPASHQNALEANPIARLHAAAREALQLGYAPIACERLREARMAGDESDEGRFLSALAFARSGALGQAERWLASLLARRPDDLEIRSLAGRISKDRAMRLPAGAARDQAWAMAHQHYAQAWATSLDPFPGVNACTTLALSGRLPEARQLADQVLARILQLPADDRPWWRHASLGELNALKGDTESAREHYRAARTSAGNRIGDVAVMRKQLCLLTELLGLDTRVLETLRMPGVVVFSGHMIDASDRATKRFSEEQSDQVGAAIAASLDELAAGIGYSSAACGGDLLFAEAMLARGGELHVFLPFARSDFIATSVAFAGDHWVERFEQVMAAAHSVHQAVNEQYQGDESLFEHAGVLMQGAACLQAEALAVEAQMLAVLEPGTDARPGGARDLADRWRVQGRSLHVINPAACQSTSMTQAQGSARPDLPLQVRGGSMRREVVSMLFADMVGFSKLGEEDTPAYLVHFLGAMADELSRRDSRPLFINTWGDGLFIVHARMDQAADCALALRDAVRRTDWAARGLPRSTSLRIGMHTGPVFRAMDPLILRENFFGSHVNRAARIEPVVPAGEVLVSAESAYLLAAEAGREFATDYVGPMPLAKGFGDAVLYRLRRTEEGD